MARKGQHQDPPEESPGTSGAAGSGKDGDVIEFDPEAPDRGAGAGLEVVEAVETVDTIPVRAEWLAAQERLERSLGGPAAFAASFTGKAADYTASAEQMLGTGIGFRVVSGRVAPEVVLKIYVTEKVAGGAVSTFAAAPSRMAGLPVVVEEVGLIAPQVYNQRYPRPVLCGVSIGHPRVTAGTLGCLVVMKNDHLCLLSNNHVIADSNGAHIGDPILQPGPADGGVLADQIGTLEAFVPINFPGPNLVDAAVGFTSFEFVDPRHVTYLLNPTPIAASLGMTVKKDGRTTQATVGTVTDVSANISVGYPGGVAQFRDQVGIRGTGGPFSLGGDSGSLVVTASSNQPVALVFAGNTDGSLSFANPIAAVIQSLGIQRFVDRR